MKRVVFLCVFILLLVATVSAAEIQFLGDSNTFDQGETLVSVVSGNFFDQPSASKVFFYRDHVRVPMVFEIKKIDNNYYIYALLKEKQQGNYSISIEGVRYYLGTQLVDDDITKNFQISNQLTDLSINPGFVNTMDEGFEIEIQNIQLTGIDVEIETSNGLQSEQDALSMQTGQTSTLTFSLDNPQKEETITIKSENTEYSIPVFISDDLVSSEEDPEEDIEFQPRSFSVSLATDSDSKRIVYLVNTGESTLNDIEFFVSEDLIQYVTIFPEKIESFDGGETEKIEIIINSDSEEKTINGDIIVLSNESVSDSLFINLDFIQDYVPPEGQDAEDDAIGSIKSCSDLEGVICSEGQVCGGEVANVAEGACCLVQCEEVSEGGSTTGKIIGWGLVLLALILLFWFFKKYKRVRPKVDLFKKK